MGMCWCLSRGLAGILLGHGVGFNPCKRNMVLAHMRGALQGTAGLAREPGGKDRGWYIRLGLILSTSERTWGAVPVVT